MLAVQQSSRVARVASKTSRRSRSSSQLAASKSVNAAATSVMPISQVQVDTPTQQGGFFASLQQMFSKKEESHDDDHAHAHVMYHSHIAEMMAMEAPKNTSAAMVSAVVDAEEVPDFHDDHAHSHTMFHSHIADKMAVE